MQDHINAGSLAVIEDCLIDNRNLDIGNLYEIDLIRENRMEEISKIPINTGMHHDAKISCNQYVSRNQKYGSNAGISSP